jgi:GNAT superfamily N-acetyltransferase
MDDWRIERLDRSYHRGAFHCGKAPLDDFIRSLVSQYEKRNLGRTFVALPKGENRVVGYFTLASGAVPFQNLPDVAARKLPRHPVPVILLARLAVDLTVQGKGLGRVLMMDALTRCLELAEWLGVHAVEVGAIDDEAKAFYQKHGFTARIDNELHLYLPIATIRDVFRSL